MFNTNQHPPSSIRFLIHFACLFFLFYGFNLGFIGLSTPGGLYHPFADHHLNYIKAWRELCLFTTAKILELTGHTVYTTDISLKVQGHAGFRLIYSCLGYGVMSFFAAFTLAFPKSLRSRIVFLVTGLISIQLLNTLRFVLIALFYKPGPMWFLADHHDVFNFALYLILLTMIYSWLNYSNLPSLFNS
ncbi:exosortase Y [Pedobacter heparinus]|uniref:exosortase Y n=1 Tax=Pedobacter heparinus TaxID=984 RepID=UPI00293004EC|nr:exosortase/archaeosortase family protein [Pedobacter heparinus]